MPEILDTEFWIKATDSAGTFEGLARTFGNEDLVGGVVKPGAFKASIGDPRNIRMLLRHDTREVIGTCGSSRHPWSALCCPVTLGASTASSALGY
jgi:phage head maturation protease